MPRATERFAFVCLDPWVPSGVEAEAGNTRPFNYAVRKVQAALVGDPRFQDVHTSLIESVSTAAGADIPDLVRRIEETEPDVVGFSTYTWSFAPFIEVAKRLKERKPGLTLIMGGPSARPAMFDLAPYRGTQRYFDALALGEGEPVVRRLAELPDRSRAALSSIPGLALPDQSGWTHTAPEVKTRTLDDLPSPYVLGLSPPNVTLQLETFRGCPFSCAFCAWGDAEQTARALSADYIAEELLAARKMNALDVFLVSAGLNLNPIAFRNLVAAEERVGVLRDLHFHCELYPTLLKDEHVEFLEHVQADNIGVGIQSFDPDVLKLHSRPGYDIEKIVQNVARIAKFPRAGLELILGLPGDSPATFWKTLDRAMEFGCRIQILKCLVLPDALMTRPLPGVTMNFDPYTLEMISCTGWSERELQDVDDELSARYGRSDRGGGASWQFYPGSEPSAGGRADVRSGSAPVTVPPRRLSSSDETRLAAAVEEATLGAWKLVTTVHHAGEVEIHVQLATDTIAIVAERSDRAAAAYRRVDGVAFSYRNPAVRGSWEIGRGDLPALDRTIAAIDPLVRGIVLVD